MKHIYSCGCLVRMKNNINVHQLLTIVFTKVLRLFEAEIFKIFKNILLRATSVHNNIKCVVYDLIC